MKRILKRRILTALPALIMMILIFGFSAQHAEESNASSNYIVDHLVEVIREVKETLGLKSTETVIEMNRDSVTFLVRKLAHTMEYALLGACIAFFLTSEGMKGKRRFLFTLTAGFLYACSDELHQRFVPGRSGEFRDVLIDTNGVFLGVLTFLLVLGIVRKREKKQKQKVRIQ